MKPRPLSSIVFLFISTSAITIAAANEPWVIDSQAQWQQSISAKLGLELNDGVACPTGEKATLRSTLRRFKKRKHSAESIVFEQSPVWQNWQPIENLGPVNLSDAPVMLSLGPDNYWMFGRCGSGRKKGEKTPARQPQFVAEAATLEGIDIPLKTTRFPNQYDAPGGIA